MIRKNIGEIRKREKEKEREEYLHICANETVNVCSNLSLTNGLNDTLRALRAVSFTLLQKT
jgi:hypothetical protein